MNYVLVFFYGFLFFCSGSFSDWFGSFLSCVSLLLCNVSFYIVSLLRESLWLLEDSSHNPFLFFYHLDFNSSICANKKYKHILY